MLNILHTFYNFVKFITHFIYSNSQLDFEINNFLRINKNIGSKDRKFLTNIIYGYYRNLYFILYISNKVINCIKEKELFEFDNLRLNNFLNFYITLLILEKETNFITELENKYHFFKFNENLSKLYLHYLQSNEFDIENIENIINIVKNEIDIFNVTFLENLKEFDKNKQDNINSNFLDLIQNKYSIPIHIIENIYKSILFEKLTINDFLDTLEKLNQRAELYIRTNIDISPKSIFEIEFEANQIKYESYLLNNCYKIDNSQNKKLTDLNSFKNGLFEIQDFSSQLTFQFVKEYVLQKLDEYSKSNNNLNIIDTCAGGGGKSLLFVNEIEILSKSLSNKNINTYQIYSSDINEVRLDGLKLRLNKSKHKRNIIPSVIDTQVKNYKEFNSFFDLAIIDAPCSGIGTIRRDANIKYRVNDKNIIDFHSTQISIINNTVNLIKDNGVILYITCSLNFDENIGVVKSILENNQNLRPINIFKFFELKIFDLFKKHLRVDTDSESNSKNYLTLFPHYFNSDGFFVALFQKV